jgi:hypothetical protein
MSEKVRLSYGGWGEGGEGGALLPFVFLCHSRPIFADQLDGIGIVQKTEHLLQEFLLEKPGGKREARKRGGWGGGGGPHPMPFPVILLTNS